MTARKPTYLLGVGLLLVLALLLLIQVLPIPNFFPISASGNAPEIPDPSADIGRLRDLAGDLRILDFPDGFDDLYDPDLEFFNEDLLGIDHITVTEQDRERWEIQKLFNPWLAQELDQLTKDLEDSLANYRPREWIPEEVVEAERLRILIKEILIDLANLIKSIQGAIDFIADIYPDLALELQAELDSIKSQILADVSYLFGENIQILNIVKNLLNGNLTEEQFRQQYDEGLPDFTWNELH